MSKHIELATPCPNCQSRLTLSIRRTPLIGFGQAGVRERTDRSTIVPPKMIPSTMTPGLIRAHHHPSTALHHSAEAHPLAAEQPAAGDKKIRH